MQLYQMINDIYTAINILCLSFILHTMFTDVYEELDLQQAKIHKYLDYAIQKAFCFYCNSFWLSLVLYHNIFLSAKIALVAFIIKKSMDKWIK